MKKCPFCAEEIQDEAIKCRHCGEFLDGPRPSRPGKKDLPWYFGTPFIIIAFLCVGPLALPLVWWRPGLSAAWKVGFTLGVLVLTWLLYLVMVESLRVLQEYYQMLQGF